MTITHIVLFGFGASTTETQAQDVGKRFLALQESCLHPDTKKSYILDVTGGKDHSPEGKQNGLTHGFVVTFANEADRDYYVSEDPAHTAFAKSLAGVVEKVTVLDYTPGKF